MNKFKAGDKVKFIADSSSIYGTIAGEIHSTIEDLWIVKWDGKVLSRDLETNELTYSDFTYAYGKDLEIIESSAWIDIWDMSDGNED